MAILRRMFATNQTQTTQTTQNAATNTVNNQNQITVQAWGAKQAGRVDAHPDALLPCLQSVLIYTEQKIREDVEEQERRKDEIRQEISGLEAKNNDVDTNIKSEVEKLKHEEGKIEKLQSEISDIRMHPQQITKDSFTKASFYIGAVIISFLTIYLFVFYSSAAYSAFFKNFTPEDGVIQAIFDAEAFFKAWNDGFAELILILTIPAVFLGLGFLIHKFQEQKNWGKYLKIAGLVVVTFAFDFILAYEITKKLYNIEAQGAFEDMPPMTISYAFQQVNFWLIIFAGFVVYLIWGFVFSFVMDEYEKMDRVNYAIKTREKRIAEYKTECKSIREIIKGLQTDKNKRQGEIESLRIKLNRPIIYFNDVRQNISGFFAGWLSYMYTVQKPNTDIAICTNIKDRFLANLQNNVDTGQPAQTHTIVRDN
ncbi:MAG: hypothetical protein LBQ28_03695 [Prevotellaceae bacterium]|jgi:uncharacterized membrane protein (DUF106 family)|nr:hypothetical protein [Prevotellaceae bacterium]